MSQKLEQQRAAAIEAVDQAWDAVEKATVAGLKWYLTRVRQEKERLGVGGEPEVVLGIELHDAPEWQRVEAKFTALMRLSDAADDVARLWLR
ncbi:hypothetical protein [Saccharopolyspora sp. NPDC002376]